MSDTTALEAILARLTPADQRLLRELAYKLAARQAPAPCPPETDLAGHVAAWASHLLIAGKRPRTVQLYRGYVDRLLREYPRPDPSHIELFLARGLGLSIHSRANSIQSIRSFFCYLAGKGLAAMPDIAPPPRPQRERAIPTAERVARLLAAAGTPKDRALILTFAACGLRAAELLGARRSDVNLEKLRITVVGKGNKQRTVPMTEQTATALLCHIRSLPPSPWLFPGKDPQRPHNQSALNERFRVLSSRAGIARITPHQLRHYFASSLLNTGVSLKIVSQLLGHASPDIAARVYWHLLDEQERIKVYERQDPLRQINKELEHLITRQLSFDFDQ